MCVCLSESGEINMAKYLKIYLSVFLSCTPQALTGCHLLEISSPSRTSAMSLPPESSLERCVCVVSVVSVCWTVK